MNAMYNGTHQASAEVPLVESCSRIIVAWCFVEFYTYLLLYFAALFKGYMVMLSTQVKYVALQVDA